MTLQQINRMGETRFIETLGSVFEHSTWVAEGAWHDRPFASVDELHQRMVAEVAAASQEQRLGLLRAHPDLGTRARISAASTTEQAGVGLDKLSEPERERLVRLNAMYQEKFGFPFIFAVKGADKATILEALERRTAGNPEEEVEQALQQVYRIARFRLEETVDE